MGGRQAQHAHVDAKRIQERRKKVKKMTKTSPIFKDAAKAAHFSFVIEAYPASQQSQMGSVIRTIMRQCGIAEEPHMPAANFGNMTTLEIHGECGRIRETVTKRLPVIQAMALQAKFSHDQNTKRNAIKAVVHHVAAALNSLIKDMDLIFTMINRHYIPEDVRGPEWSLRAVADQYQASKDRLFRASKLIEQHIAQLELAAIDNLRRELEAKNLIDTA
jgi:hypothetical protein